MPCRDLLKLWKERWSTHLTLVKGYYFCSDLTGLAQGRRSMQHSCYALEESTPNRACGFTQTVMTWHSNSIKYAAGCDSLTQLKWLPNSTLNIVLALNFHRQNLSVSFRLGKNFLFFGRFTYRMKSSSKVTIKLQIAADAKFTAGFDNQKKLTGWVPASE